jgi:MoxR-like ATPase
MESSLRVLQQHVGKNSLIWTFLALLRLRAVRGQDVVTIHDSAEFAAPVFDISGVRWPDGHDQPNVFFDPGAAGSSRLGAARNSGAYRNTYLERHQSLLTPGVRKPKLLVPASKEFPLTLELESGWIQALHNFRDTGTLLTEHGSAVLTWLFRRGIPKAGGGEGHYATIEDGELKKNPQVQLISIPEDKSQLVEAIAHYLRLDRDDVLTLFGNLDGCPSDAWSADIPLGDSEIFDLVVSSEVAAGEVPREVSGALDGDPLAIDWDTFVTAALDDNSLEGVERAIVETVTALRAGKYVILYGPPGTGKTQIANSIAHAVVTSGGRRPATVTATSEWTSFETIGGYVPANSSNLEFRLGIFSSAIDENRWLLVDELNRADFDKAFGELFTLFSGSPVRLHYKTPDSKSYLLVPEVRLGECDGTERPITLRPQWRMLGTMNSVDKSSLFQLSYAFMRRFAFVYVPIPSELDYRKIIKSEASVGNDLPALTDEFTVLLEEIITGPSGLRSLGGLEIGPAIAKDVVKHCRTELSLQSSYSQAAGVRADAQIQLSALSIHLFPQFEGRTDKHGPLVELFVRYLGSDLREDIERQLRSWTGA